MRIIVRVFLVLLLVTSCSFAIDEGDPPVGSGEEKKPRFHFGLRWVHVPEFVKLARALGADWVTIDLKWVKLERERGKYTWETLDNWIGKAEAADLETYLIVFCVSPWGTPDFFQWLKDQQNYPVQNCSLPEGEENKQAWKTFIKKAAERYDCDGIDDMPGLTRPVNYFQIAEEWPTNWYKGSNRKTLNIAKYVEMIKLTSEAVKEANPNAKIAVAGLTTGYRSVPFAEGYIDDPDGDLMRGKRLDRERTRLSRAYRVFKKSVDYIIEEAGESFDVFAIHAFEEKDTFLEGKIKWLRNAMAEKGLTNKEIVLSDGCAPFVNSREELAKLDERGNIRDPEQEGGKTRFHGDYSFEPWTLARQAAFVVKMNAIAMANGAIGPTFVLGTLDKEKSSADTYWNGPFQNNRLVDGMTGFKPAFHTYRMMTARLKGFTDAREIQGGKGDAIYLFRVRGRTIVVAWNNKGSTVDLSPVFSTGDVRVTSIVTRLDGAKKPIKPPPETVDSKKVEIGIVPVFVEAVK